MKNRFFSLLFILVFLLPFTTYSQDYKKYWEELNSTIELQGKIYNQCETGIRVLSPDSGTLCIRTIDWLKDVDIQVYINIPIIYNKEEKQITIKDADKQPATSNLYFTYRDWRNAEHPIKTANCEIYTRQFSHGKHLIFGQLDLTLPDSSITKLNFGVFDYINEIHPKIIAISSYRMDIFEKNKGEINIDNKKVSMPYAIIDESVKHLTLIYLTDRLFAFNNPLDYAVRINFHSEKDVPIGNFTLSDKIVESVSIFNHGREEKAKTAKLEIKEVKRKGYNIKYTLETDTGKIITGNFQGNLYSE